MVVLLGTARGITVLKSRSKAMKTSYKIRKITVHRFMVEYMNPNKYELYFTANYRYETKTRHSNAKKILLTHMQEFNTEIKSNITNSYKFLDH